MNKFKMRDHQTTFLKEEEKVNLDRTLRTEKAESKSIS